MIISPFTPIFFRTRRTDGIDSQYVQTFAESDRIFIQLIGTPEEVADVRLIKEPEGRIIAPLELNTWDINETTRIFFTTLSLSEGFYSIYIDGYGTSEMFKVTNHDCELDLTTLVQYSMKNNRQRDDTAFFIDGMQYFFDFRVPGGFKDSDVAFSVESEQFVTDRADIVQLYSLESEQETFTLGTSQGCPVWFASLLNRILSCSYVYFDGMRYARQGTNTPQINVQLEGVNSFVFTQQLQRVRHLDPKIETANNLLLRSAAQNIYRKTETNNFRKI